MKRRPLGSRLAVSATCLLLALSGTANAVDLDAAARHTAEADKLAGTDLLNVAMLCRPSAIQGVVMHTLPNSPSPSKMFDNLYFMGFGEVTTFVITTSAGIIVIDAMESSEQMDKYVIDGVKKLGLDPANIKYLIPTHGHTGHIAGAKELQDKVPGLRIMLSAADWDFAVSERLRDTRRHFDLPKKDMVVTDGEKLTLGDETITMYVTPGHTPGTISFIIPVKDHGVPHIMALWGGSTFEPVKPALADFRTSMDRFRTIMADAHAEGRLSTHPYWTNVLEKLETLRDNPDGPNPFLEKPADMERYGKIQDLCWQATLDRAP